MPQDANAGSKMQAAFTVLVNASVNQEVFFSGEEGGSFFEKFPKPPISLL